jgi:hypothetical protein
MLAAAHLPAPETATAPVEQRFYLNGKPVMPPTASVAVLQSSTDQTEAHHQETECGPGDRNAQQKSDDE